MHNHTHAHTQNPAYRSHNKNLHAVIQSHTHTVTKSTRSLTFECVCEEKVNDSAHMLSFFSKTADSLF